MSKMSCHILLHCYISQYNHVFASVSVYYCIILIYAEIMFWYNFCVIICAVMMCITSSSQKKHQFTVKYEY